MRPRRAMNEEWMADIHVTGSASCSSTRALEGRSGESFGHVAEEHTLGAKWGEYAGNVEMRPYQDLRRRIRIADVREQEQRQEPAASAVHVGPPLSVHVVAAVDVPTGVSRILHAREPNRNGPADSFARKPTAWSEKRVVRFSERRRRPGCRESGTFGAREAHDGLGPRLGIARIDRSRPQFAFDDVHAGTYGVRRHSTPHHEETVRAQPFLTDFHCRSRSAMSSARFSSSRPSRMLMSWGSARQ